MILHENVTRREYTRCHPRIARRCRKRTRTGRDVEWIDRQVLVPAEFADVRKTFLSPFACAIFLRRERGRSGEWRSYLLGRTGDTATLIRAPCNGKPMNFSSPLATLFFPLVPARVRPVISSFLLSLLRRAIRQPADLPLSPRRDWRVHPYFRYVFISPSRKLGRELILIVCSFEFVINAMIGFTKYSRKTRRWDFSWIPISRIKNNYFIKRIYFPIDENNVSKLVYYF